MLGEGGRTTSNMPFLEAIFFPQISYRGDSMGRTNAAKQQPTIFAFMKLVADHTVSIEPLSALQPYPALQLADRS